MRSGGGGVFLTFLGLIYCTPLFVWSVCCCRCRFFGLICCMPVVRVVCLLLSLVLYLGLDCS